MPKLAINGGKKIRNKPFTEQKTWGKEEQQAVNRVLKSSRLTGFQANAGPNFLGGEEVKAFEYEWCEHFSMDFKYAIAVNSCTSALVVACGAIGIQPGDEVIVTPWSMTCSATAPMFWGGVPVFADIEDDYFCLDPKSVESKITEKTKAIIVVDLFGQPYDYMAIKEIANKYNLKVIEDAAQAPGAYYDNGKDDFSVLPTGALGDIGCFSFNQGKHLTCGEGGMITTNDPVLADRCRLIRNHAEAVLNDRDSNIDMRNMWGLNVRMTEIEAAIMREQLKKFDELLEYRIINVISMKSQIRDLPGIEAAPTRDHCTHVYYVQPFLYDKDEIGVHRNKFIAAVKAELEPRGGRENEGVPIGAGYIRPIYKMPLFYSTSFNCEMYRWNVRYLQDDQLFYHLILQHPTNEKDISDLVDAFHKVWENREELR